MSHDRLTCLVPTYNRPEFLRRLLQFYRQHPMPCSFFVADSSRPDAAAENLAAIDQVRNTIDITYRHFDAEVISKCRQALEQICTPHVVFCADDDYLLPDAVERCLGFLESHPDYAVAQGLMAVINCKQTGKPPFISAGFTMDDDDALPRCRKMALYWFTTFYGVYRTETLLDNFRITSRNLDCARSYFFPEMLLSQLSVLKGKVKVFPEIHFLHESHDANLGATPKVSDHQHALELYQQFRECLTSQWEQIGVSRQQAERLIEKWYGFMLEFGASNLGPKKITIHRFRRFLRRMQRQILNLFAREGIFHRRSIRTADWQCQEAAWQEALRLMVTYPQGLPLPSEVERVAA